MKYTIHRRIIIDKDNWYFSEPITDFKGVKVVETPDYWADTVIFKYQNNRKSHSRRLIRSNYGWFFQVDNLTYYILHRRDYKLWRLKNEKL